MDMKLEVVVLPVSDVDRAKQFYETLGWRLDADFSTGEDYRIVQMTPPGSPASVHSGPASRTPRPGRSSARCSSSTTSRRRAPSSSPGAST